MRTPGNLSAYFTVAPAAPPVCRWRYRKPTILANSHGRSFCPECGSRLFDLHDDDVEIRLGTLDDAPTGLMPMQEGWTIRREHWLTPLPGVVHATRDPPG